MKRTWNVLPGKGLLSGSAERIDVRYAWLWACIKKSGVKRKPFGEVTELTSNLNDNMSDGRLAQRISAEKFTENSPMSLTIRNLKMETVEATLLNISETGMAVITNHEFVLGQLVSIASNFKNKIPNKAVVMWSCKEENGYRAGLRFVSSV
jgi:hypothetical protein